MCLSNVYLDEREQDRLLLEEVEHLISDDQGVRVRALLGESRAMKGCYISEVNLMENYVILRKRQGV